MTTSHQKPEAIQRGARMLRTALGPAISRFLEDVSIVEVMLNPDGRIWVDRLSEGLADTGERLSAADGAAATDAGMRPRGYCPFLDLNAHDKPMYRHSRYISYRPTPVKGFSNPERTSI